MNISIIGRACRFFAISAILLGSASCVNIDESLGGNFIPTDQIWDVYPCEAEILENITMSKSDKLSGYSTTRFTFGAVKDDNFACLKSSSFTLVPLSKDLDFGKEENGYPEVRQFHLSAVRDTLSMLYDHQERILQNVYVYALKEPLDSTTLYTNTDLKSLAITDRLITEGVPVYNGGDSLSIDLSKEYGLSVIKGIKAFHNLTSEAQDSISNYLTHVPGIVITTDVQAENGGRINMFNLAIKTESGYITGNYAELKFRGIYDYSEEPVDTSFLFYFGPSDFLKDDDTSYPTEYAFNASDNYTVDADFINKWEGGPKDKLYVEGGSGYKPVIKAREIKDIVERLIKKEQDAGKSINTDEVVINKASIILPYNVNGDYGRLDKYPMILSPTVRLTSDDEKYTTYAGLTDSSIESENQGDINRSLDRYSPDVSHHVQEILNLKQGEGEDVPTDETNEAFEIRLAKYDIWMLIMHEEVTEASSDSSYDDYYNNLLYNSYYNNMMYDPYGYGYGYGGYGYGYGGYGYDSYGYNNYYNYYMMAAYASASSSSTTTTSSIELDKDRFYNAELNGPNATGAKPSLKITFSAPKVRE